MVKVYEGNLFNTKADVLCHQCNCQGVMGSGIAAEVKSRYPWVYAYYRSDYLKGKLKLGYVVFGAINEKQVIANLCGQDGYGYIGVKRTNYEALQECLNSVKDYMEENELLSVAFSYNMSCCRGGGDWTIVYNMICETFKDYDIEIWRLDNC